jgi:hypothetical protein
VLPKLVGKFAAYGATLREVGDTAGGDEKISESIESAFAVESEVEIFVGEDVDDVTDNWFINVDDSVSQNLVNY